MATDPTTLESLLAQREQQNTTLTNLRDRVLRHDPTATDEMVDLAVAARESTEAAITAMRRVPAQRGTTATGYEHQLRNDGGPEVYNAGNANGIDGHFCSWISDAYRWQVLQDWTAMERLQAHAQRVDRDPGYEGARRAAQRSSGGADGLQTRAGVTSTAAAGLVPPTYLVDYAALLARAGRPFANALNRQPLPPGMQLILPKETTGVSVASQASENTAVSNTDAAVTNTTYNVATIAGQSQVSRQTLERGYPGIDQFLFADLAGAYSSQLDAQLFTGSGASGQLLGIVNAGTINTATLFGAAATVQTFYTKLAGQQNAVNSTTITGPANVVVMHPRRWAWLLAAVDTQNRPLFTPDASTGVNVIGGGSVDSLPESAIGPVGFQPVGTLQGIPLVVDANVPTTVGGGSTEDVTYLLNRMHAVLFEDNSGAPTQLRFEQTLGNQLTVTLVAYGYAVAAWRYLLSIGRVGGADATGANGTQAPSF
jgi:hypothetical protein